MPQTNRRSFLAALPMLAGFDLDKDNDGDILDDLLGLNDDESDQIGSFYIATDASKAEEIDPVTYPAVVVVTGGSKQGIYSFDGEVAS